MTTADFPHSILEAALTPLELAVIQREHPGMLLGRGGLDRFIMSIEAGGECRHWIDEFYQGDDVRPPVTLVGLPEYFPTAVLVASLLAHRAPTGLEVAELVTRIYQHLNDDLDLGDDGDLNTLTDEPGELIGTISGYGSGGGALEVEDHPPTTSLTPEGLIERLQMAVDDMAAYVPASVLERHRHLVMNKALPWEMCLECGAINPRATLRCPTCHMTMTSHV